MNRDKVREEVYELIDGEREYQNEKWPDDPLLCPTNSLGDYILMVDVYLDKAKKVWQGSSFPEVDARNTMRKIAAIAVRCMEEHGAEPRAER